MEQFDISRPRAVGEVRRDLVRRLSTQYGEGEARAMTGLIFHALNGWNATDLVINSDKDISPFVLGKMAEILGRLHEGEPLQYILGKARFYGMDLVVSPAVLIPRPETEELVDMIVKENAVSDLRVLDVGTGSGAIAIALSRNLRFPDVTAVDISAEALAVACENARALHARITFLHEDVFRYEPAPGSFDIIVSNPPYVAESEKKDMDRNVLAYEPAGALFVSDAAPLVYYGRISAVASDALVPGGRIYFEINPLFAEGVAALMRADGFEDVRLINDISGRTRFAAGRRPCG